MRERPVIQDGHNDSFVRMDVILGRNKPDMSSESCLLDVDSEGILFLSLPQDVVNHSSRTSSISRIGSQHQSRTYLFICLSGGSQELPQDWIVCNRQ